MSRIGRRSTLGWRPGGDQLGAGMRRRRNPYRRWLQPLFHQQCWCWGEDIRRPEGNLLLAHGLRRERGDRTSRYRWSGDGLGLTLWGFGAVVVEAGTGSAFVDRATLRLRLGPDAPPEAWSAAGLTGFRYPQAREELATALRLFGRLAAWVADYESWIPRVTHPCYRAEVLHRWDDAVVPAEAMAARWRRAATVVGSEHPPGASRRGSESRVPTAGT